MKDGWRHGLLSDFPRSRFYTYKTTEDRFRAFCKYVCKRGDYSPLTRVRAPDFPKGINFEPLEDEFYRWPEIDMRRFTDARCMKELKNGFESKFQEHRDKWEDQERRFSQQLNNQDRLIDELGRLVKEANKEIRKYENNERTTGAVKRRTRQLPEKNNNGKGTERNSKRHRKVPILTQAGA